MPVSPRFSSDSWHNVVSDRVSLMIELVNEPSLRPGKLADNNPYSYKCSQAPSNCQQHWACDVWQEGRLSNAPEMLTWRSVPVSERPLPIGDLQRIYAELVGMVLAGNLLVEQALASARSSDAETRHAVDCVNG